LHQQGDTLSQFDFWMGLSENPTASDWPVTPMLLFLTPINEIKSPSPHAVAHDMSESLIVLGRVAKATIHRSEQK